MEYISISDMNTAIEKFLDTYWGTAIGESIYRKRANTVDDDYYGILEIYNEIKEYVA